MEIQIFPQQGGEATGKLELADTVFAAEYNEALIHQVVVAYQANGRAATSMQKNRAAVSGGGAKPWRQKGTGRARAGTSRSPLWRGGGNTFVAADRHFGQKINRKMYRGAMRALLSELIRQDRLRAVDEWQAETVKSKEMAAKLGNHDLSRVLIVSEGVDDNLALATRNLRGVNVVDVQGVDPVSLLGCDKVLVTAAALKKIEERLQ
ncbi:MAG: 50S ribosomal protein L4 [Gammaproteobacteria bacterium]|nr:50S ribosomal protein L4 [Gammaproteobacteria bacterium]